MMARGRWQGVLTIARFNWPFYAISAVLVVGSLIVAGYATPPAVKIASLVVFAVAAYFLFVSLAISHRVYDRSDLYHWAWLYRALEGTSVPQMVSCHCGFDETSPALRSYFAATHWTLLDHFDDETMTEASIRRARRKFPPSPDTAPAKFDQWPVPSGSASAVFGLLAIHELRSESERTAWFAEARRCLTNDGRVILAEHPRGLANFVAFGPGALHFHSRNSWRRCWEGAGLSLLDEFRPTLWVTVFVLVAK
jgi:hypothetical protein